jgi:hypothetical protein
MFCAVAVAGMLAAWVLGAESQNAEKPTKPTVGPSHRVVACYFHRTVRCPTCRRISAYIEEGIQAGFAREIQEGRVSVAMMDFQDPKNERFTSFYKITGPTLVLMDIRDGKVAAWKPAPKVWSLVGDKEAFFRYVQGEVRAYLEGK